MFLENRKRKWIVSYDVTIDGNKEEDLEHTLTADNICKAVKTALEEIYGMVALRTSDKMSVGIDLWDVCEVEE